MRRGRRRRKRNNQRWRIRWRGARRRARKRGRRQWTGGRGWREHLIDEADCCKPCVLAAAVPVSGDVKCRVQRKWAWTFAETAAAMLIVVILPQDARVPCVIVVVFTRVRKSSTISIMLGTKIGAFGGHLCVSNE